VFEFETRSGYNYFPIGIIQEYLSSCDRQIQNKVKNGLVNAEFCNMNILKYLEYIAKAIGE
jgi:hypothetical protein